LHKMQNSKCSIQELAAHHGVKHIDFCCFKGSYLWDSYLLNKKQYGFIKSRSTILQLLHMLDKWIDFLDYGGQIDAIYTDFEKAFDKVPHKI